jgi:hypothetical protein
VQHLQDAINYGTFEISTRAQLRRADTDYAASERDAKRARLADADYATSERDAKRARANVLKHMLRARNSTC